MGISIGKDTKIWHPELSNIYGDGYIGDFCNIGAMVEIRSPQIGHRCKIQAFVFIPEGVIIGNNVFIGPNVTFVNDKFPRSKKYPDKQGTVYRSFVVKKATIPTKNKKLFIVETEDHPISYGSFKGTIPQGYYGAGKVEIWDKGTYELLDVEGDKKYLFRFVMFFSKNCSRSHRYKPCNHSRCINFP